MLHEDTEYLPTCGAIPVGRLNGGVMDGKVLTKNVVLLTECATKHCTHTGELTIKDLRDHGPEGECPVCGDIMIISQECLVRN